MNKGNHVFEQKLSDDIIGRLIPGAPSDVAEIESRYSPRALPIGAQVTRIAPSPTGFMHVGVLYTALISERIAHLSDGVFYLRIEDTDRKREVEGAQDLIVDSLARFGIKTDEGVGGGGSESGHYGPYAQSQRSGIYQAYIKQMLKNGQAYPCFMTTEELEDMTKQQNAAKLRPGYYGDWAKWRNKTEAEVTQALDQGLPFVIRYRSTGDINKRRTIHDVARGELSLPESDNDIVIMKRDGLPTYHLAHAIDDHLMQTTLVVRGDEWLPSTTLHIQLCETLGFEPFTYAHVAPLQKTEGGSRRKLSKRKDPEASLSYYNEAGYLPQALIEYLLNQANSSYESWREQNPTTPYAEFPLNTANLSKSGALFSLDKLDSVSADYIATLSEEQLYELIADWASKYDQEFAKIFTADPEYSTRVLGIERSGDQPRKDLKRLSDAPDLYGFFFDSIYGAAVVVDAKTSEQVNKVAKEDQRAIVDEFMKVYDLADSNEEWFEKLKAVAEAAGFAAARKDFKDNPEKYKGTVADAAQILRVGLTKRSRTPNLHEMMQVMGVDRAKSRLDSFVG